MFGRLKIISGEDILFEEALLDKLFQIGGPNNRWLGVFNIRGRSSTPTTREVRDCAGSVTGI